MADPNNEPDLSDPHQAFHAGRDAMKEQCLAILDAWGHAQIDDHIKKLLSMIRDDVVRGELRKPGKPTNLTFEEVFGKGDE